MEKYYTGIGSRNAPQWALNQAIIIAKKLAGYGYILRSGGATGMDTAFEKGCDSVNGKKEIYLPWRNFNNNNSPLFQLDKLAEDAAKEVHPAWNALSDGAKKLHTRNVYQIVGKDWKHLSNFVICYTPWNKGGTLQALRIAKEFDIPIFNLIDYESNIENAIPEIFSKVLITKYNLKIKNSFYCKLFNNYRYDGKCTEMGCEFCDGYYDEKRKKWWYHPESNSFIYDSYYSLNKNESFDIGLLVNVDNQIKTRVVNLKDHEYDVYIGRGSKWGNPFKSGDRNKDIKDFYHYFEHNDKLKKESKILKGKRLGCYCSPENCHGDIIAEFIENTYR